MLFPYDPEDFWEKIRLIIREEVKKLEHIQTKETAYDTSRFAYKPLYKIAEVCKIFGVSKPTIYDWIKHKKLKPYKIRSRVYFLWNDIQTLLTDDKDKQS